MKKWEYKTLKVIIKGIMGGVFDTQEFNDKLNSLGQEGWELVSAFVTTKGEGISREAVATFKRPVE